MVSVPPVASLSSPSASMWITTRVIQCDTLCPSPATNLPMTSCCFQKWVSKSANQENDGMSEWIIFIFFKIPGWIEQVSNVWELRVYKEVYTLSDLTPAYLSGHCSCHFLPGNEHSSNSQDPSTGSYLSAPSKADLSTWNVLSTLGQPLLNLRNVTEMSLLQEASQDLIRLD